MRINTSKIKQLRKQKGLTQGAMATKLGISRVTYMNREKHNEFTDKDLTTLSKVLEVTEEQVFVKEDSNNDPVIEKDQLIAELRKTIARQEEHIRILFRIISKQNKEE